MRSAMVRGAVAAAIVLLAALSTAVAVLAPVGPATRGAGGTASPGRPVPVAPSTLTDPRPDPPPSTTAPTSTTRAPADRDPRLVALAEQFLADPSVVGHDAGLSVWVDGPGEVLAVGATQPLQPASVQKLATAFAVLERLDPTFGFTTLVTTTAPVGPDGTVAGDVVLVGGGDPTLARSGPHSLDALAAQVRAIGVRRVAGRIVVDTTRWSTERAAPGWLDWHQPRFVGWLSALLADGNRWQAGADALDPGLANGRWFAETLAREGVTVAHPIARAAAPTPAPGAGARVLASLGSAPRDGLVEQMLLRSDNLIAEAFFRELGRDLTGLGTHEGGTSATQRVLADLLLTGPGGVTTAPSGQVADGSGLSRVDRRSAGEWQALLVAARLRPWWPVIRAGLPTAGVSGTLSTRFGGTAAAGNAQAKTGTTIEARSLAGVLTGASGRTVMFAVVVNGTPTDGPIGAEAAIDRFVADLVSVT